MSDYNKIDVSELFHTYGTDFQRFMNEAESLVHKFKSLSTINPNNKTVYSVGDEADELLNSAQE